MYLVSLNVPKSHLEEIKNAVFNAGAGKIGNYSNCSWEVLGKGQFKPEDESNPFIGSHNQLETIDEYKLEFVCSDDCIKEVIANLKKTHPYETPSYQVIKLEDF